MKIIIQVTASIFILSFSFKANSQELQFNCTYKSEVKITNANAESPKAITESKKSEYIFFINKQQASSSFLNLAFKIKSNLKLVVENPSMMTLIEDVKTDNHFSVSIFTPEGSDKIFNSVIFVHTWNPSNSFYLPSMRLGSCQKIR